MHLPHYEFSDSGDSLNFQFESISDNRRIVKLIQYEQIDEDGDLYNLALVVTTRRTPSFLLPTGPLLLAKKHPCLL
ncbi:hypothetical protein GCM10023187_09430 [Nibrella viscosa]|uniref:Uncharacterized protein n=1 Tax=Nibrella viscosa TaxID=1084524 RepID=A0ABP8K104_9BACT